MVLYIKTYSLRIGRRRLQHNILVFLQITGEVSVGHEWHDDRGSGETDHDDTKEAEDIGMVELLHDLDFFHHLLYVCDTAEPCGERGREGGEE